MVVVNDKSTSSTFENLQQPKWPNSIVKALSLLEADFTLFLVHCSTVAAGRRTRWTTSIGKSVPIRQSGSSFDVWCTVWVFSPCCSSNYLFPTVSSISLRFLCKQREVRKCPFVCVECVCFSVGFFSPSLSSSSFANQN